MAKKKYDPLWEVVGEKRALQGQEIDIDAHCPYCNVNLHLGAEPKGGARVACGLCGGVSTVVVAEGGAVSLAAVPVEELLPSSLPSVSYWPIGFRNSDVLSEIAGLLISGSTPR